MNDLDLYMARTQARLAYFLITVLVFLSLVVIGAMIVPNVHVNQEVSSLMTQVVTGVLALAGTATAFFFARHRPPTASDGDGTSTTGPLVKPQPEKPT